MRVLVEQTVEKVKEWINNLGMKEEFMIITMMGGDIDRDYKMNPERRAVIIGTQDMLLSRALNRGYGINMFQWPIEFGLLNNDCLWVMDEVQLMGNGLATSVQLDAFRNSMKTFGPHKTVWMSATINPQWLQTVDFTNEPKQFCTSKEDLKNKALAKRNCATKRILELKLPDHSNMYTRKDAEIIMAKHVEGTITLVILNTVKRAQSLFAEIQKIKNGIEVILIHSRFRTGDRMTMNKKLTELAGESTGNHNAIIISTQVVEAGVDISSKTMITEIAPWPSMVQRFGRCNRRGEHDDAEIHVIKLEQNQYIPYENEDMERSAQNISKMIGKSVSPANIPDTEEHISHEAIVRKRDIMGLFDTIPDIYGSHTDISRFIRSVEESKDVSVFWRKWKGKDPNEKYKPKNKEICSVSISDMNKFLKGGKRRAWSYDPIYGKWEIISNAYPGQTMLLRDTDGCYTEETGWDLGSKKTVTVKEYDSAKAEPDISQNEEEESHDSDTLSELNKWITLNDHTVHVKNEMERILEGTNHLTELKDTFVTAVKYHDLGKAHRVFQDTMLKNTDEKTISRDEIWAKRGGKAHHNRENFRHEAISAVAFLKLFPDHHDVDLIAYLIAAHHGKVRMSMRPLPKKRIKRHINPNSKYILGMLVDGEEPIPVFLSSKNCKSAKSTEEKIVEDVEDTVRINAEVTKIGRNANGDRSWLQITLGLLNKYGPFRLAYLEAVIRAADSTASKKEAES